jgi:hypothetical protein
MAGAPNLVTKSATISPAIIITNAITGPSSMRAATSTLDPQFRMLLIARSRVRNPACWQSGQPPLKPGTRFDQDRFRRLGMCKPPADQGVFAAAWRSREYRPTIGRPLGRNYWAANALCSRMNIRLNAVPGSIGYFPRAMMMDGIEGAASHHIGGIAVASSSRTRSGPQEAAPLQSGQNEGARDRLIAPTIRKASPRPNPATPAAIHEAQVGKLCIDVPRRTGRGPD